MDRIRETEPSGGLGTAVIPREADPLEGLRQTAPSPCRWPTLAITDLAMGGVDAARRPIPSSIFAPTGTMAGSRCATGTSTR